MNKKIRREELNKILSRNIELIKHCDNKASISLGFFGTMLTIFFTNINILEAFKTVPNGYYKYFYILFSILIFVFISIGLYRLIMALLSNMGNNFKDEHLNKNSNIFFENIAKKSYKQYRDNLLSTKDNDLIFQIYIDAKIASQKYKNYENGLLLSFIGFLALFVLCLMVS
ncbi:MAG: hypothetical protein LBC08_00365 [Campylobacteraceae bacterium]|jgi:hypothetical protein|nr:hypothetical protein [Campylobacteraceae bacterium]